MYHSKICTPEPKISFGELLMDVHQSKNTLEKSKEIRKLTSVKVY